MTPGSRLRTPPFHAAVLLALVVVSSASPASGQGIAAKYVRDVGIANDPDVILTEMFEDSVAAIASRWNQAQNSAGMSLTSDIPAVSGGTRSLLMTSVGGTNTGGHLYKNLGPGYDQVYLRYYIKYSSAGTYHHTGGWLGGYNPPTDWPQDGAGEKPTGSDRFSIGPEPTDAALRFDLYTYWMEMRVSPDGVNYWQHIRPGSDPRRIGPINTSPVDPPPLAPTTLSVQ